jgi:hypothetical protein
LQETQTNARKRMVGKPFQMGNPGGPGRPVLTLEQKLIKKAVKEHIREYEETLAEALPRISKVLIAQASRGNIKAIREIHQVVGAHKNNKAEEACTNHH